MSRRGGRSRSVRLMSATGDVGAETMHLLDCRLAVVELLSMNGVSGG